MQIVNILYVLLITLSFFDFLLECPLCERSLLLLEFINNFC